MTRTYYFLGDSRPIAEVEDSTIHWRRAPRAIAEQVHEIGPVSSIVDSTERLWTGDSFWSYAGDLAWDTSRVGQAVPS